MENEFHTAMWRSRGYSRVLEGDPSRDPEERLVDDFNVPGGSMWPDSSGIY
jgi:hypothetical protein